MPSRPPSSYRYCIVPLCTSTSKTAPTKIFVHLPIDTTKRSKWCQAARRADDPPTGNNLHVCEDHFNLESDAENYMQYKMMPGTKLRMKPDILPHKFACQAPRSMLGQHDRHAEDSHEASSPGMLFSKKSNMRSVSTQTRGLITVRSKAVQASSGATDAKVSTIKLKQYSDSHKRDRKARAGRSGVSITSQTSLNENTDYGKTKKSPVRKAKSRTAIKIKFKWHRDSNPASGSTSPRDDD